MKFNGNIDLGLLNAELRNAIIERLPSDPDYNNVNDADDAQGRMYFNTTTKEYRVLTNRIWGPLNTNVTVIDVLTDTTLNALSAKQGNVLHLRVAALEASDWKAGGLFNVDATSTWTYNPGGGSISKLKNTGTSVEWYVDDVEKRRLHIDGDYYAADQYISTFSGNVAHTYKNINTQIHSSDINRYNLDMVDGSFVNKLYVDGIVGPDWRNGGETNGNAAYKILTNNANDFLSINGNRFRFTKANATRFQMEPETTSINGVYTIKGFNNTWYDYTFTKKNVKIASADVTDYTANMVDGSLTPKKYVDTQILAAVGASDDSHVTSATWDEATRTLTLKHVGNPDTVLTIDDKFIELVDNVVTTDATKALTANQGKVLNDNITNAGIKWKEGGSYNTDMTVYYDSSISVADLDAVPSGVLVNKAFVTSKIAESNNAWREGGALNVDKLFFYTSVTVSEIDGSGSEDVLVSKRWVANKGIGYSTAWKIGGALNSDALFFYNGVSNDEIDGSGSDDVLVNKRWVTNKGIGYSTAWKEGGSLSTDAMFSYNGVTIAEIDDGSSNVLVNKQWVLNKGDGFSTAWKIGGSLNSDALFFYNSVSNDDIDDIGSNVLVGKHWVTAKGIEYSAAWKEGGSLNADKLFFYNSVTNAEIDDINSNVLVGKHWVANKGIEYSTAWKEGGLLNADKLFSYNSITNADIDAGGSKVLVNKDWVDAKIAALPSADLTAYRTSADQDVIDGAKANSTDVYLKTETYTKAEVDGLIPAATDLTAYRTSADQDVIDNAQNSTIGDKANSADVYAKTETYTKTEVDGLIPAATDLTPYRTKADQDVIDGGFVKYATSKLFDGSTEIKTLKLEDGATSVDMSANTIQVNDGGSHTTIRPEYVTINGFMLNGNTSTGLVFNPLATGKTMVVSASKLTDYITNAVDASFMPKKYIDDAITTAGAGGRTDHGVVTVATMPTTMATGDECFVSDESGGSIPAFYDGTNWRRVTDRAIVS